MVGCKSEYDSYVSRELSKNMESDSLIFGMRMGQTKKEFFDQCWQLNKDKVLSQGDGNATVKYLEPLDSLNENTKRKSLLFYGEFDDNNIMYGMDMAYEYTGWALWNEEYHSQPLMDDLKAQFLRDYGGNEFIEIDINKDDYKAYVKIDGNRQILMYPQNNKTVIVKIEDLNHILKKKE